MLTKRSITAAVAALAGAAALAGPAVASAADVKFRNDHDTTIYVAYMRLDVAGCGEYGRWQTKGWLKLAPGQTKGFSTTNKYAYFYAEATDGAKWSGDGYSTRSGPVYIYEDKFDSCLKIGSTAASDIVRMRRITVGGGTIPIT
jgi:uncharacterized membrane protein